MRSHHMPHHHSLPACPATVAYLDVLSASSLFPSASGATLDGVDYGCNTARGWHHGGIAAAWRAFCFSLCLYDSTLLAIVDKFVCLTRAACMLQKLRQ
jgi:hypothetical protein